MLEPPGRQLGYSVKRALQNAQLVKVEQLAGSGLVIIDPKQLKSRNHGQDLAPVKQRPVPPRFDAMARGQLRTRSDLPECDTHEQLLSALDRSRPSKQDPGFGNVSEG
jgi:hypothetical protein